MKKLFLLDAYALIFRAYYAFIKNPRFNSKGLNTSAILGFTNTIDEVLKKEKPTHIAVVFDPPTPNFRKKIFPEYKANRKPTPEDIIKSVPYIKQVIEGFNIPVIEIENYEADDTIGTLAKQAEKLGFEVYMMTPDKDFGQLVSDKVFMYKPRKGKNPVEILGAKEICEKYGIQTPKQVIDILAIWGDVADNVPGIPGIGEKTSAKLIAKYKSVEGLYDNLYKLKGKQKENVAKSKELAKFSKHLVTIALDVPVEFNEEKFKLTTPNYENLKKLFTELEFNALQKRIIPDDENTKITEDSFLNGIEDLPEIPGGKKYYDIKNTEHEYVYVDSVEGIKELVEKLSSQNEFCFDTETTSTNTIDAELVGIAFSFEEHRAFYVPILENQDKAKSLISEFKEVLENDNILKIGQNIKFDINVLANYDIHVKGKLFDTMIAHYLLYPERRHNLTKLSETYLNYTPVSIEELIGKKGKNQLSMRMVDADKIKEYAGEDADITYRLKKVLLKELVKNNLTEMADNIEFPLVYVLSEMEINGVNIDVDILKNYELDLKTKIEQLEEKIINIAGTKFNIASPKQLGIILFDHLKIIDKPKKTKTGQYSTSEQELRKLIKKHEIIELILNYRSLSKLQSTYVQSLPNLINKKTNRIHTSYNQAVTSTGRLSSTNPNLQNIPIRTLEGRKIREAFSATDENHVFISADYSQVELRIMAHLSQDSNMLDAFSNNEDIHTATAAKIFKVENSDVTPEMRSHAKSANFGIIYGISAHGLSENLKISRAEAKKLIDGYFETYPKVKEYMNNIIAKARENEFVETIFGRKRFLGNINSRNHLLRSIDERNAINAPIQGTAADIIKIAMINCLREMKKQNLKSKMILQVHDELNFDALVSEKDVLKEIIVKEMESAAKLSVPLIADIGEGKNWLVAH